VLGDDHRLPADVEACDGAVADEAVRLAGRDDDAEEGVIAVVVGRRE
jgi:hypothetical protein